MTITEMQNNIVAKFGLEHENTIKFFRITQYKYSKMIKPIYNKMMSEDISADEDDE